jgi:hypothetical protein
MAFKHSLLQLRVLAIHICQGEKAKCWAEKENNLHSVTSSCKLMNALSRDFPVTARVETAKHCLDRLDVAMNISADLNPYKS